MHVKKQDFYAFTFEVKNASYFTLLHQLHFYAILRIKEKTILFCKRNKTRKYISHFYTFEFTE